MNRLQVEQQAVWIVLWLLLLGLTTQVRSQNMPSKADKQYEMGMYEEAAASYSSSLAKGEGTDLQTYERLAACYCNINKPIDAIETYESAAMRYDMSADAYKKWAGALKKIGRVEEANEILSFASIKSNVSIADIKVPDNIHYDVTPVDFNSERNEFAPAWFGDQLICVTDNYSEVKVQGVSSAIDEQPHVLMKVNTATGEKSRLSKKLKDYLNDGPACYTADRRLITYSKGHFPAAQSPKIGTGKAGSIYVAECDENGEWDMQVSLSCNELGVANIYPFFQPDGKRVYFASNRDGGYGGFDIWYMDKVDGGWMAPKNMGPEVNTSGDEISPSINGNTMFFASDQHHGYGGFDLFAKDLTPGQPPVNLGQSINSTWDDYALITKDGAKSGYFTSNREGGAGGEDIYHFNQRSSQPANQKSTPVASTQTTAASAKTTSTMDVVLRPEPKPTSTSVSNSHTTSDMSAKAKLSSGTTFSSDIPTFRIAEEGTDPGRIKTVYTIQVAALTQDGTSFKAIASKLGDIGLVYRVFHHNMTKIRVGQYSDENEARKKLLLVKSRGYADAFVVKEQLISDGTTSTTGSATTPIKTEVRTESQREATTTMVSATKSSTTPLDDNPVYADKIPADRVDHAVENMSRFRIKLGSYTNKAGFDDSKIKDYGTVFKEENGEWTQIYLGDYLTIEDAEAIRVEVKRNGFDNALIYGIQDDKLIRVSQ